MLEKMPHFKDIRQTLRANKEIGNLDCFLSHPQDF